MMLALRNIRARNFRDVLLTFSKLIQFVQTATFLGRHIHITRTQNMSVPHQCTYQFSVLPRYPEIIEWLYSCAFKSVSPVYFHSTPHTYNLTSDMFLSKSRT